MSSESQQAANETETVDLQSYVLLLFMGIIWGLAVSMSKIGATNGGHPIGLALWQTIVAGSMLLAAMIFSSKLPKLQSGLFRFSLVCGAWCRRLPSLRVVHGSHLSASRHCGHSLCKHAAVYVSHICALSLRSGESAAPCRYRARSCCHVASSSSLKAHFPLLILLHGVLLALAASVSMSLENFYASAHRPEDTTSLQLSCGRQFGASLILLPIALLTSTTVPLFEA